MKNKSDELLKPDQPTAPTKPIADINSGESGLEAANNVADLSDATNAKVLDPATDISETSPQATLTTNNNSAVFNSQQDTKDAASSDKKPGDLDDSDHLNTDKRDEGNWESRYSKEARVEIRIEACIVSAVFILTLVALLSTWTGRLHQIMTGGCGNCLVTTFNQYSYFFLGGLLGGNLYGVKYLYKVVARGYWNIDRRLWRLFSPFMAGGLALAVGALVESGMLGLTTKTSAPASFFSLGFIAGYFADSALAKMQEIAETVFGSSDRRKH